MLKALLWIQILEAADEIARQIKIRDLSGLIIIDFIEKNVDRIELEFK